MKTKIKRRAALLFAVVLGIIALTACGGSIWESTLDDFEAWVDSTIEELNELGDLYWADEEAVEEFKEKRIGILEDIEGYWAERVESAFDELEDDDGEVMDEFENRLDEIYIRLLDELCLSRIRL